MKGGDKAAREELAAMMDAVKQDCKSWFGMGRFACKRKLSNGAVVRVSITMPPLPAKKREGSRK